MRIPISWLAEYVRVPEGATPEDVATTLVRVGLEEEGITGGEITGPVVVGRVLTAEPEKHKNGKTVNWCSVDVGRGADAPQWIVCGAHNFSVGDDVVVAMPGAVLPGNFAISARKTYGHTSSGMICSVAELGLGEDHSGIIVLGEMGHTEVTPGQDALELLGLAGRESQAVEINVTPDRGYCLSMRGVAREYAHGLGQPVAEVFSDPADLRVPSATADGFPVTLAEDAALAEFGIPGCSRFVARLVKGVSADAESPQWMQRRLLLAGMRPISLVVDATNYAMLALGQPLHAYDVATLDTKAGITVRRARDGETLTTLDDTERELHPEDLVIADGPDGGRVIGMAGVMGGAATEVSASTTDVLIEAAWFDPLSVARTARRHKLPSEASKRFERGVDTHIQAVAAQFVVDLLVQHGGGKASPAVTDVGAPRPGISFEMPTDLPAKLAGVPYTSERVIAALTEIGCDVTDRGESLTVTPPTWRPDLAIGADVAEEVARLDGYDKIPSVLPTAPAGGGLTHEQVVRRNVAQVLVGAGLHEVVQFPFVGADRLAQLRHSDEEIAAAVRLTNPLNSEQPLLRMTLLSTLVDAARRNLERGVDNPAVFELGQVVLPRRTDAPVPELRVDGRPVPEALDAVAAALPPQPIHAAGVLCGEREPAGWQGTGRAVEYTDALAVVYAVTDAFSLVVTAEAADVAPWHPGRCARFVVGQDTLGYAGELHPQVCDALRLPPRSVAFEVDVDVLAQHTQDRVAVREVSTFGVVKEDVALIVSQDVTAREVELALIEGGGDLLESVRLFDVYTGDSIADGKKSLAFALRMRAPNRTLNADESARVRGAAVAVAEKRFDAVLRDK